MRELKPVTVRVAAPRDFCFDCLTAFGAPSPVWEPGLEPEIIEHAGPTYVVRRRSRVLGRLVTHVLRMELQPPESITIDRVEGRPHALHAELTLAAVEGGTDITLRANLGVSTPVVGGLVERLYAVPLMRRGLGRTMQRYRVTIDAASRASGRADDL